MSITPLDQAGDKDNDPVASLAVVVLETIVSEYERRQLELPKRRTVVIGELAVEEEVLGVMFGGCHVGGPGAEVGTPFRAQNAPTTAIFNVELWREITTGRGGARAARAPRSDVVTAQARTAMIDCWVLLRAAYLCDYPGGPGVVASTAVQPPQGGLQGISLSLSIQVP